MRFKKLACVVVIALLLCGICLSYTACKDKHGINELHQTAVIKNDLAEYGNFVWGTWDKIYRYNRKTETLYTACTDPECDGKCPVDCVITYLAGVHDQKLYFCGRQQFTGITMLGCQDVVTGETYVLKTMDEIADPNGYLTFVDGDWLYYRCMLLKDGGDATVSTDYEPYVCRISLDGKKDEPINMLASSEMLCMAADDKIVTGHAGKLYVTDVQTKQKEELFDLVQNGFTMTNSTFQYYNGKVYFVASSMNTQHSEYTGQEFPLSFLVRVDLNSHQADRVVEVPVFSFSLTEEGIFYVPFEIRHLYVPDNYVNHPEKVSLCLFGESLYFCDLDGNNAKVVYSNDKLFLSNTFTVIDNVAFGWFSDYDEQKNAFSSQAYFGAVDLDSGRIVRKSNPNKQ